MTPTTGNDRDRRMTWAVVLLAIPFWSAALVLHAHSPFHHTRVTSRLDDRPASACERSRRRPRRIAPREWHGEVPARSQIRPLGLASGSYPRLLVDDARPEFTPFSRR